MGGILPPYASSAIDSLSYRPPIHIVLYGTVLQRWLTWRSDSWLASLTHCLQCDIGQNSIEQCLWGVTWGEERSTYKSALRIPNLGSMCLGHSGMRPNTVCFPSYQALSFYIADGIKNSERIPYQ